MQVKRFLLDWWIHLRCVWGLPFWVLLFTYFGGVSTVFVLPILFIWKHAGNGFHIQKCLIIKFSWPCRIIVWISIPSHEGQEKWCSKSYCRMTSARKIVELCEYAAENPFLILKVLNLSSKLVISVSNIGGSFHWTDSKLVSWRNSWRKVLQTFFFPFSLFFHIIAEFYVALLAYLGGFIISSFLDSL